MQAAFASHNFHTVYYKVQHIKAFFSLSEHTHAQNICTRTNTACISMTFYVLFTGSFYYALRLLKVLAKYICPKPT